MPKLAEHEDSAPGDRPRLCVRFALRQGGARAAGVVPKQVTAPSDSPTGAQLAQHRALLYDDADEFVNGVAPFIRVGLQAGDAVFVALPTEKLDWLREELGDAADGIEAVDAAAMYSRNGPMLNSLLQRFLVRGTEEHTRVVAEQALAARTSVETRAYLRYEAAANVAYEPFAASVLCPYDRSRLPDAILRHALETHPDVLGNHGVGVSEAFVNPRAFVRKHSVVESPPAEATEMALEHLGDVASVRHHISQLAQAAGLSPLRIEELAVAVTEIATNALRHGGPPRGVWSYVHQGAFVCHVHDSGPGFADPLAGYLVPDPIASGGRGLWLAHQLCDIVEATTDDRGTRVCVRTML